MFRWFVIAIVVLAAHVASAEELARVGVFDVDASPPVGSPMAYDPTSLESRVARSRISYPNGKFSSE